MLADRLFIIAVDPAAPEVDGARLKELIKNSDAFRNWWNHIPSLYLVNSGLDAAGISALVSPVTNGARFLVMEVNPAESEGWLPERGWNWIRRRSGSTKLPKSA
jgi:hypothetical protein